MVKRAKSLQICSQNGNSGEDMTHIEKNFEDINHKKALLAEGHKTIARMPVFGMFRN